MNRFEWFKAVLQSGVSDRAKALAGALAVEFANNETGQINPALDTLADYLRTSVDTVRRALADLITGGWLARNVGRGKGRTSNYTLMSPGSVVPFRAAQRSETTPEKVATDLPKRSQDCHLSEGGKGSRTAPKRSQNCKGHIKQEQSSEQKGRATDRPRPDLSCRVDRGSDAAQDWAEWLARHGHPTLKALTRLHRGGAYDLPYLRPPRDCDEVQARITAHVIAWAKGARDADAA